MELVSSLLLVSIILLITLIHETGHLIFARILNVPIDQFAIGFGPNLIAYKDKKNTKWSINLIPLGGYISIGDQDNETDYMLSMSPGKRILIALGGPLFNIISFFISGVLFYSYIGPSSYRETFGEKTYIVCDGIRFQEKSKNWNYITKNTNESKEKSSNKLSIVHSGILCKHQFITTSKNLVLMFTSINNLKKLQSILMATKSINKSIKSDKKNIFVVFLFYFFTFSLSVGLLNLLPLFGLDGGWILVSIIKYFVKFSESGDRNLVRILSYSNIFLFGFLGFLLSKDIFLLVQEFFLL